MPCFGTRITGRVVSPSLRRRHKWVSGTEPLKTETNLQGQSLNRTCNLKQLFVYFFVYFQIKPFFLFGNIQKMLLAGGILKQQWNLMVCCNYPAELRREPTEKFTKHKDLQDPKGLFMPLLKDADRDYTGAEERQRDNNMLKNVPLWNGPHKWSILWRSQTQLYRS